MKGRNPFLKVNIVSTTERTLNSQEILEVMKNQVDESQILYTSFSIDAEEKVILEITGESEEEFKAFFKQDFYILDKIMELLEKKEIDLRQFFPETPKNQKSEAPFENYLVLRYITNFPDPVRENLRYFQWFSDQINEFIHFEEISDGFLRFYRNKLDYQSNNLIRNTMEGMQEWLKLKNVSLPQEIMEIMVVLLSSEEYNAHKLS